MRSNDETSWRTSRTRASRFVLVCSGKAKLLCKLLLHWTQGVLVGTTGGPMVTFANTTGHNLLSFNFIHGVLILVLGIQILKKKKRSDAGFLICGLKPDIKSAE